MWTVATNILNKQSQSVSGGPPAWGLFEVLTTSPCKNLPCYKTSYQKNCIRMNSVRIAC